MSDTRARAAAVAIVNKYWTVSYDDALVVDISEAIADAVATERARLAPYLTHAVGCAVWRTSHLEQGCSCDLAAALRPLTTDNTGGTT